MSIWTPTTDKEIKVNAPTTQQVNAAVAEVVEHLGKNYGVKEQVAKALAHSLKDNIIMSGLTSGTKIINTTKFIGNFIMSWKMVLIHGLGMDSEKAFEVFAWTEQKMMALVGGEMRLIALLAAAKTNTPVSEVIKSLDNELRQFKEDTAADCNDPNCPIHGDKSPLHGAKVFRLDGTPIDASDLPEFLQFKGPVDPKKIN